MDISDASELSSEEFVIRCNRALEWLVFIEKTEVSTIVITNSSKALRNICIADDHRINSEKMDKGTDILHTRLQNLMIEIFTREWNALDLIVKHLLCMYSKGDTPPFPPCDHGNICQ
jgi:hypothetical protein